jgi:hypothetical protein
MGKRAVRRLKTEEGYEPTDFTPLPEWIESGRGGRLFNTSDKVDWILRCNRAEVLASGEFIPGSGARASHVGPNFGKVLLAIQRRKSTALG